MYLLFLKLFITYLSFYNYFQNYLLFIYCFIYSIIFIYWEELTLFLGVNNFLQNSSKKSTTWQFHRYRCDIPRCRGAIWIVQHVSPFSLLTQASKFFDFERRANDFPPLHLPQLDKQSSRKTNNSNEIC